ncbi:MAG: DUF2306 domain-containing protein [Flavobacteriaceae bacterium]
MFYAAMLVSAIAAIVIASLPGHQSAFLFAIGLFSTYFIISGRRSLYYKQKAFNLTIDKILAYMIVITGGSMLLYPLVIYGRLNIILTVFGSVGLVFGLRDLKLLKDTNRLKNSWLKLHLGKMSGGYIAAVSAFFVVNQILPGIWNWFAPGIVGSGFIAYWMIKVSRK